MRATWLQGNQLDRKTMPVDHTIRRGQWEISFYQGGDIEIYNTLSNSVMKINTEETKKEV